MNRACFSQNATELASSTQLNLHEHKQHASSIRPLKNYFVRTKRLKFLTFIALMIWAGVTESCEKDETMKEPVITWATPADIPYGTLLSATQLNATADVPGTFVYSPAIGTKLDAGVIQDLKVDFTPTDANNNNKATKTVKINVIANPTNGKTTAIFNSGITYGTLTDQDGNDYKTITLGTQTWMAENLRTTRYNNGTAIPNVTGATEWKGLTSGAYCNYNNITGNDTIAAYGRLYNWYAVNTGKLAPEGWHVPTEDEWITLETYLGGEAGGKLKESTTTHWYYPNTGATNESGFTALPGGYRSSGLFGYVWDYGVLWSATEYSAMTAYYRLLDRSNNSVYRDFYSKESGFSVRCVKD